MPINIFLKKWKLKSTAFGDPPPHRSAIGPRLCKRHKGWVSPLPTPPPLGGLTKCTKQVHYPPPVSTCKGGWCFTHPRGVKVDRVEVYPRCPMWWWRSTLYRGRWERETHHQWRTTSTTWRPASSCYCACWTNWAVFSLLFKKHLKHVFSKHFYIKVGKVF